MFSGPLTDKLDLINDLDTMEGYMDPSFGSWRLATLDDMNLLWEYDADEIFNSFDYNFGANGVTFMCLGIYDEAGPPNEIPGVPVRPTHYTAAVEWYRTTDTYTKHPIPHSTIQDDGGSIVLTDGAWVACNAVPAPVPEPCTLLLLGSGLVGLIGFRGKLKK